MNPLDRLLLPEDPCILLRDLRRSRGLTQRRLARLSGVGEKSISSFECGLRIGSLSIRHLQKICAAFGITLRQFFNGDFNPPPPPEEVLPPSPHKNPRLPHPGGFK